MIVELPITGTLKQETPIIIGDDSDPIRPVEIDLRNVSWTLIELNLELESMIIEVEPSEVVIEPEPDGQGGFIYKARPATEQEKQGFLQYVRDLINDHTKDELYQMSNSPRLKRPE